MHPRGCETAALELQGTVMSLPQPNSKSNDLAAPNAATAAAPVGKRSSGRNHRDLQAIVVVICIILLIMQIASEFEPDYVMPSLVKIFKALIELLTTDPIHVILTLGRLALSVIFSMIVGVVFGLLMGTFKSFGPYLRALVIIDTGIPALTWMLVAVFWFKGSESRIFFILSVIIVPFYALNVYEGVRSMPSEWLDMIESFRPSRWQTMRFLVFPHVVPYVLLTTKSVIGYAIRMAVFAEYIASNVGIGARMNLAQSTFHMDQVLAWTFILVVLNLILQWLAGFAEKHLLKWRKEATVR